MIKSLKIAEGNNSNKIYSYYSTNYNFKDISAETVPVITIFHDILQTCS